MKISDGYWLNRNGYNVSYAVQIAGIETDENSVTVYAAHQWIANRGMTLGGPLFTVRFTSVLENSIKVTIEHFSGSVRKNPDFPLYEAPDFRPVIRRTSDGGCELISGKTSVTIGTIGDKWDITYRYNGRLLTKSGQRTLSVIEESPINAEIRRMSEKSLPFFAQSDNGGNTYIRDMLGISVGEYIYGYFIFGGNSIGDVIQTYTTLTGKP
ncbi:MAG: hypothetical protein IJ010_09610, partial [Ruminococcus sp.]|nr:hypothetical protein [Ruminococcus sp.]